MHQHFILESKNCNNELINNPNLIKKVINELTKLTDMKILYGPIVIKGNDYNSGYTGFAIIDYSHISIHTFTDKKEISVDVFTCNKKYDNEIIKNYLIKVFKLNKQFTKSFEIKR
jgi:S-adenosylmethionine decarboxylase